MADQLLLMTRIREEEEQIKEDTVEPSVPAPEFNLKAYTVIT